ncbi:hypothetical protein BXO88_15070 [Oribacterium sp. C9]|nr:hypothetical protein BXO88_15070 [Oribacterium sp. C9]
MIRLVSLSDTEFPGSLTYLLPAYKLRKETVLRQKVSKLSHFYLFRLSEIVYSKNSEKGDEIYELLFIQFIERPYLILPGISVC